ncbi:MAG: hypothetical protein H8E46_09670 [FCB group bacterium]|nr:hypothetical protein [FCB group bacterium]
MNLIQIYREGNEWRALIGHDPDTGIEGRADSPVRALAALLFKLNITPWEFKNTAFKPWEEE